VPAYTVAKAGKSNGTVQTAEFPAGSDARPARREERCTTEIGYPKTNGDVAG